MKVMLLIFLMLPLASFAKGRLYFKNIIGHVHENPNKLSTSKTMLQCSHSVKVLGKSDDYLGWTYVKVGEDRGYIQDRFLSSKRPGCFQGKYPQFFIEQNLNLTQMYFWGKLYDHYIEEVSRAR